VRTMPDFGTMRENEAAFDMAVTSINSGDIAWACAILKALRDHIWSTEEPKMLEELTTCTPTMTA
jgi:hypothetical protein